MLRKSASWQTWAFGFLAGALLSALRAPLGLDLLRVIAVDAKTSLGFRAVALLAIAVAVYDARIFAHGVPMLALLASALIGFLAHGLAFDAWLPLGSRGTFAVLCIVGALALNAVARLPKRGAPGAAPEESGPIDKFQAFGLCLAGGGAACAVESIARPLRTLGLGLEQDDTVFTAVFLFALVFGCAAFGALIPARGRRAALAVGLALGALACAFGADRLASFADPQVLKGQVESLASLVVFESDVSSTLHADIGHVGTWRVDAVLAASCLFVPGLVLGAALGRSRGTRALACVLVGAAFGLYAMQFAGGETLDVEALADGTRWATLIGASARIAAAGGALALVRAKPGVGRLAGFAGTALVFAAPSFVTVRDPRLFTPWDEAPKVVPQLAIDTPEGLLTVERARGVRVATLDRVRLTPVSSEHAGDEDRIRKSLELLGEDKTDVRVLLVGQSTPERSSLFERLGVRPHYTSPWWRHAKALDEALFEGAPAMQPGEVVAMNTAAKRIRDGEYDLVIVPPVFGQRLPSLPALFVPASARAPRSSGWDMPAGSIAVVWLDAALDLAQTDLREHVLVSAVPIEEPSVGVVIGTPAGSDLARGAPSLRQSGSLSTLRTLAQHRKHRARAQLFERLADSNAGGSHGELMRFLALHFAAQDESTPFASRDERVEIDPESLAHLRAHALANARLDSTSRVLIEDVAVLLTSKRRPDLVREFVLPIAEAHRPWYALDTNVLVAFMEFDMEEEVAPRLADLLAREPHDLRLMLLAAEWEEHRGREEAALVLLERVLAIQPNRADALKRMALLHHRRGSTEAQEWVRKALEAAPDDHELLELDREPVAPSAGGGDPSDT